jgi:hypothetical protein
VKRVSWRVALATLVAAATLGGLSAPAALASGRPGGQPVTASGQGSLGSQWKLKSMHDDANGQQIVGEEFEINGGAGQVWDVTFADNGTVFFSGAVTATAQGLRVNASTPNQVGTQTMSAHAVNETTGEVVDGSVALPPLASTRA